MIGDKLKCAVSMIVARQYARENFCEMGFNWSEFLFLIINLRKMWGEKIEKIKL